MSAIVEQALAADGFIVDEEVALLVRYAQRAHAELPSAAIVEIGSYLGRSTIALAGGLNAIDANAVVHAIDPHEGDLGPDAAPTGRTTVPPTYDQFCANIRDAQLESWVVPIRAASYEVTWDRPIGLLFIDALHDLPSVERDFRHFEPWLVKSAYTLFHDYAQPFWGVTDFVDGLLRDEGYALVDRAANLVVIART